MSKRRDGSNTYEHNGNGRIALVLRLGRSRRRRRVFCSALLIVILEETKRGTRVHSNRRITSLLLESSPGSSVTLSFSPASSSSLNSFIAREKFQEIEDKLKTVKIHPSHNCERLDLALSESVSAYCCVGNHLFNIPVTQT
jgi:hypothetical protein